MVYLISDLHWGEPNIEELFFASDFGGSVEAYETYTKMRWKQKVKDADTILIVGDAGVPTLYTDLPGRKILIRGNHDTYPDKGYEVFDKVVDKGIAKVDGYHVSICHQKKDSVPDCDIYVYGHYHQIQSYINVTSETVYFFVIPNLLGYEPRTFAELSSPTHHNWRFDFLKLWDNTL